MVEVASSKNGGASQRAERTVQRFGTLLVAVALSLLPGFGRTQTPDGSLPTPIEELLEITGVFRSADASTDELIGRLRRENPSLPAELWPNIASRLKRRDTRIALYVPIYARHLSEADADALLEFFRSPAGAHWLAMAPRVQEGIRQSAVAWAASLAETLAAEPSSGGPEARSPESRSAREAADRPLREGRIEELLRLSGTLDSVKATITARINEIAVEPESAGWPPAFWDRVRQRLQSDREILRQWAPVYRRNLTSDDVQRLVVFYRSPLGRRYVAALSKIEGELTAAAGPMAAAEARKAVREVLGPLPQWRLEHPQGAAGVPGQ